MRRLDNRACAASVRTGQAGREVTATSGTVATSPPPSKQSTDELWEELTRQFVTNVEPVPLGNWQVELLTSA